MAHPFQVCRVASKDGGIFGVQVRAAAFEVQDRAELPQQPQRPLRAARAFKAHVYEPLQASSSRILVLRRTLGELRLGLQTALINRMRLKAVSGFSLFLWIWAMSF